ncbi:T-Box Transcription Factor Tbx4 [Manis pentadactyla]|nr:T-Box Transcription Factor Tbx4 [Manis pentadactyla]
MDSGAIRDRAESTPTFQSLSCSRRHDIPSSPGPGVYTLPAGLPRKPTLSLQRPPGGGWGKKRRPWVTWQQTSTNQQRSEDRIGSIELWAVAGPGCLLQSWLSPIENL